MAVTFTDLQGNKTDLWKAGIISLDPKQHKKQTKWERRRKTIYSLPKDITEEGYIVRLKGSKWVAEHRLVYEAFFYTKIPSGYHIHHIDQNKQNNDITNLMCLPEIHHFNLHAYLRLCEKGG